MSDTMPATGETCGIEIELENISSNINFSSRSWRKTHDASIESDILTSTALNIPVHLKNPILSKFVNCNSSTLGIEVVSPIMEIDSETTLNEIKSLVSDALRYGEKPQSERSGIHFHISLAQPALTTLKSIIRLGRNLEALFFLIGGMGYEYRGIKNDSTYCRPITKFGPPTIPFRGGQAQIFNTKDVLKVRTREEFWYLYGDCVNHGERYNPVRYTWLNLYPLCPYGQYKGTLEFRVFNKTLNPVYIYSTLMLCKRFVYLALKNSYSSLRELSLLDEHSIYDKSITKDDIFKQLLVLYSLTQSGNDDDSIDTILKIMELSPQVFLDEKYVRTHIRNLEREYWGDGGYTPEIIPTRKTEKPKYIDIHVLRGEIERAE